MGGERSLIEVRGSAKGLPRLSRSELLVESVIQGKMKVLERRTGGQAH